MRTVTCTLSVILAVLGGAGTSLAHAPRSREARVVIQSVDPRTRTLSLTCALRHVPQRLIWNANTGFIRDGRLVSAAELKAGTHATVCYHSPFFGRPYLTRVVWVDGEEKTKHPGFESGPAVSPQGGAERSIREPLSVKYPGSKARQRTAELTVAKPRGVAKRCAIAATADHYSSCVQRQTTLNSCFLFPIAPVLEGATVFPI